MRSFEARTSVGFLLALSGTLTWAGTASAQPAPPAPSPTESAPPPAAPTELLQVSASGVTGDAVGARAAATSYTARAAEHNLRAAAARVDAAWAAFLPRLTVTARYTRLSDFTPPSLGGSGSLVGTLAPPGTINPTPTIATSGGFTFPLVLNNYLLQANITVPISDYFLRIDQNYTAATHSQDAARFDAIGARAKSGSDGKIAYYTWLRARGAIVVAVQALNDQKTHLKDANNQFQVGNASRADTLRAETAVASAELAVERAKNLAELTEKQVRQAMHAKDEEILVPGESLEAAPPPFQGNLRQLTIEAHATRYEIKSIDANTAAAKKQAAVARAGRYPTVSAFADAIYANPNPRRFPATEDWFGTWDIGAQITWSPNDVFTANAGNSDAEARASALDAQRMVIRDGIELEVVAAYQGVREADFAIGTSKRELDSATEAYRVARELFNNGRGTSTTLTDAETELTRARLDVLNAAADARIARARLEHALGRDARMWATL